MPAKKLTVKQKLFVDEYLIDLNATQAAIRSGYSQKTAQRIGSENLSKLLIQDEIQVALKKREEKTEINAAWVLIQAAKVYARCMQETPVLDAQGEPTGEYKFEHTGANKALDTIGKHISVAAFPTTHKHELTGKNGEPIQLSHEDWLNNLD